MTSLIMTPVSLVSLHGSAKPALGPAPSEIGVIGFSMLGTVKQPLMWLPVLGGACVLLALHPPALLAGMANEIAQAAGGAALFTLGLMPFGQTFKLSREVLANVAVKNVLQPALLLAAGLALGLSGTLLQEIFLIGVLPLGMLVRALAHSNKAYESEALLTSMASMLFSSVSISAGIAIARGVL